jgi:hypothetical protein
MATVITIQPSPTAGSAASPAYSQAHHSPSEHLRRRPHPSSTATPNTLSPSPVSGQSSLARVPGRDGASCDACLRRQSRCAMNDITNKCYSCDFHRQDCTFTLSAGSAEAPTKKRKLDDSTREHAESVKRYAIDLDQSLRRCLVGNGDARTNSTNLISHSDPLPSNQTKLPPRARLLALNNPTP